ncbi:metal dependent phosphohydrolase [Leptotrichia trevisanii]|uniref:Metal dependent phosphohydrolase n=1 Tax=Leptotrichia trevisanii TaxID=109328 RepID=A0A510KXU6_9FUSO|nr:HDIG domain-containing metalloprotein [Leptotrichia trevisanii]BBM51630.1 metal dependent phosphohydrolase [Leptotrichia trevisanii]BBM56550.1 metal dependent phosphohydrolase [Leptotrichia trevisanii]
MRVNIRGREFVFEVKEKKSKSNGTQYSGKNRFMFRFIVLMITFMIFGIIIEMSRLNVNYVVGSIAKSDIVAYKNVSYFVDILDDSIEEKITKTTQPEFDKIKDVNKQTVISLNKFLRDIRNMKPFDDATISRYIKENEYTFTIDDIKEIARRTENVEYSINLMDIISEIYSNGIYKMENLSKIIRKKDIKADTIDMKVLQNFIKPNLVINEAATKKKIADNMMSLRDKEIKIYKGDIIVKKGEIIDSDTFLKLEKLNLVRNGDKFRKTVGLATTFSLLMTLIYYLLRKNARKVMESKAFYPTLITIIFVNTIYILFLNNEFFIYLLPFAMLPIISTILGNRAYAIIMTFSNMIVLSREESWLLVTIAVSLVAVYKAANLVSRSDIVKLSFFLGIFQALLSFSYGLVNQSSFGLMMLMIVFSVFSGILTGMLSLAVLPYFEDYFEILTTMKLLELSDFSHTLLKQLLMKAPGTFHHSIMVGALAEGAAESIGANATFARIASYYHDIGKMKRPEFFVENQQNGDNPHNKIKPSLSALILTSHTKDGYIMGKENKLPKEILDVILEHHGTTLTQYFYYKALESGEEVVESNFRYSGPKPRTKESGIILLADTVEAATRTLENKSKEGIENFIRYLVKSKMDDKQLSDSDLTLGEIEKVVQSFINTLQGVYHERIKYPKMDEKMKKN